MKRSLTMAKLWGSDTENDVHGEVSNQLGSQELAVRLRCNASTEQAFQDNGFCPISTRPVSASVLHQASQNFPGQLLHLLRSKFLCLAGDDLECMRGNSFRAATTDWGSLSIPHLVSCLSLKQPQFLCNLPRRRPKPNHVVCACGTTPYHGAQLHCCIISACKGQEHSWLFSCQCKRKSMI